MNVGILPYFKSDASKLQPYWDARNSNDCHDDISVSSESAWADNILGLNTRSSHADKRPLAVEVDAYLLDSQFNTTTLNFWQVCRPYDILLFTYQIFDIGESASFSDHFRLCHGHYTHPSVSCTLRTGILICKGDNNSSTQQAWP